MAHCESQKKKFHELCGTAAAELRHAVTGGIRTFFRYVFCNVYRFDSDVDKYEKKGNEVEVDTRHIMAKLGDHSDALKHSMSRKRNIDDL